RGHQGCWPSRGLAVRSKAVPVPTRPVARPEEFRGDMRLAMGMDVGASTGSLSQPNVVPLSDILLVLIIIFMVITPLTPKGLDILVPQPSPNQQLNQELENKTVVVQVLANGKVKINNEDVTWEGLGPRMEQIFKERAEKVAFVKGDNDG